QIATQQQGTLLPFPLEMVITQGDTPHRLPPCSLSRQSAKPKGLQEGTRFPAEGSPQPQRASEQQSSRAPDRTRRTSRGLMRRQTRQFWCADVTSVSTSVPSPTLATD